MRVILIGGTHAQTKDTRSHWWDVRGPFAQTLKPKHCLHLEPFRWSTDVDGLFNREHRDWEAGGWALHYYARMPSRCQDAPFCPNWPESCPRAVIAHSHGGQVALYAAARGLKIDLLVTVCTPVRSDMRQVIEQARPHIGYWKHLYSDWSDWMQVLGSIGDGAIGIRRKQRAADLNIKVPGIGHSGWMNQQAHWPEWAGYLEL